MKNVCSLNFFHFFRIPENQIFLASVAVCAGEPAEITDELDQIDLNEYLTSGTEGVFLIRVVGDSMETEISHGDLLVVNRNLQAKDGDKIIASLDGNFTVKIFRKTPTLQLVASNGKYTPRQISRKDDFQIFGVVTHIVRQIKKI